MKKFNEFGLQDAAWYIHKNTGSVDSGKNWCDNYLDAKENDSQFEERHWDSSKLEEVATIEIIRR